MQPIAPARPFTEAIALTPLGDGRFRAVLDDVWAVGPKDNAKAHGGLLMVLMTRAALLRLGEGATGGAAVEPLAVAADFLRAPDLGAIELRTETLKAGRTASVCAVRLLQDDKLMLSATVTAGVLPDEPPRWAEPSPQPLQPDADAVDLGQPGKPQGMAAACELRFPKDANPFTRGETGPPRMSGWVRPRGEEPDVLFAMLVGDILPPTVFNLGGTVGWAPTVQLTALLRGRPAPGWLRVDSVSRSIAGTWFDEDSSVVDSSGRLICQARQLALAPLARA